MALTRQKKESTVTEIQELLAGSKLTVFAKYQGTSVKDLQELRSQAKTSGTNVKIIKNRLFIKALESVDTLKHSDTASVKGQLLYAFNSDDDVAPAQSLAGFAKTNPQVEFVGGFTSDGRLLSAEDVQILASLPSKEQLRGQLVGLIASPLSGFSAVLAGNVRGVLNVLNARAENLNG
ncbi:MAG TPA: 50S ribosomal protein L10 [Candidatus Saccharimonadales bacterium]|nr:50S ribosomal protein L10 [Candidatus Saccharimonadales bacterium]